MEAIIRARVILDLSGEFTVFYNNKIGKAVARKKLKQGGIKVGDMVEYNATESVIERVLPRKNEFDRPKIANIDQIFIVFASVPKPDFILIDKLLIKCFSANVKPIIIINKTDIADDEFIKNVQSQYDKVVEIIKVSTLDRDSVRENLLPLLEGKCSALTGQSAVGKSSILNCLIDTQAETGALSKKTARGKNTTRKTELYLLTNGGLIADTPGFSAFLLDEFTPEQILDFTPEFQLYSNKCKYNNCNHITEDVSVCAVKSSVYRGEINRERYNRYVELFKIAKEKEDKKYE